MIRKSREGEILGFVAGVKGFPRGVRWLWGHKRYLALVAVPAIVGWFIFFATILTVLNHRDAIYERLLFAEPQAWYGPALLLLVQGLLLLACVVLSGVAAFLVVSVLAAPIYEKVSVAIEREIIGGPVQELSIWASIKLMGEEIKKALFIFAVATICLFIPGLNVISTLVTAFLVGWDFYDYPLARRGWSFSRRLAFVSSQALTVTGFGLWLVIPVVNIVLMPLAVAGGTLLNLEAMRRQGVLVVARDSQPTT